MPKKALLTKIAWFGALGICAGVAALLLYPPAERYFPPCVFFAATGLYCPGCGSGRMLRLLLRGELALALGANPLAFAALPLLLFFLGYGFLRAVFFPSWRDIPLPRYTGWVVLGIVIACFILRNVPAYPFTLLAPFGQAPPLFARHGAG